MAKMEVSVKKEGGGENEKWVQMLKSNDFKLVTYQPPPKYAFLFAFYIP